MNMGMLASGRGDLAAAYERFAEAEQLAGDVGDPWLESVGRHNLGNVARDLGDLEASARHLGHALTAYVEHDDRWSVAHVLEDVALWLVASGPEGDADALRLIGAAERLREEINAPRFPPTEAQLGEAVALARARSDRATLEHAEAAASTDPLEAVVARAEQVLAVAQAG
jgi:hypothetical protein